MLIPMGHGIKVSTCTHREIASSLVVPGPRQLPRQELCDLFMSMGSCFCSKMLELWIKWLTVSEIIALSHTEIDPLRVESTFYT